MERDLDKKLYNDYLNGKKQAFEYLFNKYKSKIEYFIYNILGQTLQNTKSLIHRGKKQLRKILLKKGFDEMNKFAKVSIIIICATILMTGIAYAGVVIYNEYIKKQEEVQSRGLFDLGDGITTYEINLMANDMTWNEKSSLYHKLISNSEDYEKYKSRVSELPEVSEINFDENFIVIIANENVRQMHEKDLTIYNVIADENTTHIIMKQKENPDYNNENNIWYAIIDKSLLRENAEVTIEHREIDTRNFTKAQDLPKDYSTQDAIQDGCIVLENNKVISNNIDLLDKFMEITEKGENAFIRVYMTYNNKKINESRIKDVEYYNGIYYVSDYSLTGNERSYFNSFTNKLTKSQTSLGIQYYWLSEDGMNGTPFIIIQ